MKIKNSKLVSVINFLDGLTLKGKSSIGRTKLKEGLTFFNDAYSKDQTTIIDEFDAWLDNKKTQFNTADSDLVDAMNELNSKEVEIDVQTVLFINELKDALDVEKFDEELSGADADAYAMLVLYFEENKDKKEEEK